jgi:hypothetical protein
VLIESIYELAKPETKERMRYHGYVGGLYETADKLGAKILEYRLLVYTGNPLNPSNVLKLEKVGNSKKSKNKMIWICPLTKGSLVRWDGSFYCEQSGIVYLIIKGIPLVRDEHSVVASKF